MNKLMNFIDEKLIKFLDSYISKNPKISHGEMLGLHQKTLGKEMKDSLNSLGSGNTALLTHVSIMIAISALLFSNEKIFIFSIIYAVIIVVYTFVAILCIKSFFPIHEIRIVKDQEKHIVISNQLEDYLKDTNLRNALFNLNSKIVIYLSFALLVLVIIEAATGGFISGAST